MKTRAPKKKTVKKPKKPSLANIVETLTHRLEAMEWREAMIKERLGNLAGAEQSTNSLAQNIRELYTLQQVIYNAICNLYDVLRLHKSADRLRIDGRKVFDAWKQSTNPKA